MIIRVDVRDVPKVPSGSRNVKRYLVAHATENALRARLNDAVIDTARTRLALNGQQCMEAMKLEKEL